MNGYDQLTLQVITIIAQVCGLPADQVLPEASFQELGIDSLTGLGLLANLEEAFKVSLPNEEALRIRTVKEAVECLRRLTANHAVPNQPPHA